MTSDPSRYLCLLMFYTIMFVVIPPYILAYLSQMCAAYVFVYILMWMSLCLFLSLFHIFVFLCVPQMWMSVSVSSQRFVRMECVSTTSLDTAATAPVDMFTTARCWSASVRTSHSFKVWSAFCLSPSDLVFVLLVEHVNG